MHSITRTIIYFCFCICCGAYGDEPVSSSEASICPGGVVQYVLYVVAIVQFASSDGESEASTPGLGQNYSKLKLFNPTLSGRNNKHVYPAYCESKKIK